MLNPTTALEGTRLFKDYGALVITNAFPPALVHSMNLAFRERYHEYFREKDALDALPVGNRRKMITVSVEGVFNNPRIYANPFVTPIMSGILGKSYILNGYGSVVSLPGSKTQHKHSDYTGLFLDDAIDSKIPTFAVTVIIPLVAIDETVGTTRVWPGSHKTTEKESKALQYFDPVMPLGACLLMDYMLVHNGQANHSDDIRPIMYNIYSKPWFRDDINYVKQSPLIIPESEYNRVPPGLQKLFAWSRTGSNSGHMEIAPEAPCMCGSGRKYSECHGKLIQ